MRRGRKVRHDSPPSASAVGPGVVGGKFRPLSEHDVERVHHAILDVLENIGMGDPIPILSEHALKKRLPYQ